MSKTIRSHRARVLAAKSIIEMKGDVPLYGREAYVEFLLIEDIEKEYKIRNYNIRKMNPHSEKGAQARLAKLETISYLLKLWEASIELLQVKLEDKEYFDIRKAINEHELIRTMRMGNPQKQLKKLTAVTEDMLRQLDEKALEMAIMWRNTEEHMEEYNIHHDNAREYYGVPNVNKDELFAPAEVIPANADSPIAPPQLNKNNNIAND